VTHEVVFAPEARGDLRNLYIYIATHAGNARAIAYLKRIEAYCRGFADFPLRGVARDDLFPGLRLVGFERRISIAFHVNETTVTFDRILYGGREIEALLSRD